MNKIVSLILIVIACFCEFAQLATSVCDPHAAIFDMNTEESSEQEASEKEWQEKTKIRPTSDSKPDLDMIVGLLNKNFTTPSLWLSQFRLEIISPPPESN